eukprot:5255146-Pleurochrysis_carterae.AAC.4
MRVATTRPRNCFLRACTLQSPYTTQWVCPSQLSANAVICHVQVLIITGTLLSRATTFSRTTSGKDSSSQSSLLQYPLQSVKSSTTGKSHLRLQVSTTASTLRRHRQRTVTLLPWFTQTTWDESRVLHANHAPHSTLYRKTCVRSRAYTSAAIRTCIRLLSHTHRLAHQTRKHKLYMHSSTGTHAKTLRVHKHARKHARACAHT